MGSEQKSKVVLIPCNEYKSDLVYEAVKQGINLLGGFEAFIGKDEKILLKPNLLKKALPEAAVTTHPAVFGAVAKLLRESGYTKLGWGDSPGVGPPQSKVSETAGIKQAAAEYNLEEADFGTGIKTVFSEGRTVNSFIICKGVHDCDAIINLCKMKTHALERITGAVKNTFGCVYGFNKGTEHAKYPDPDSFAKMLSDLNVLIKPRLHIMDAVVAMEGNGPGSGDPVPMNLLLFSTDPVAMDSVFCSLVHLDPSIVPTNTYGEIYGVGKWHSKDIEIITTEGIISIEKATEIFGNPHFNVNRGEAKYGKINMFSRLTSKRPYIVKDKCIKCGICVDSCPLEKKALSMNKEANSVPVYDYTKCIRCYCCQEMCPQKAIHVKTPFLAVLLDKKKTNK